MPTVSYLTTKKAKINLLATQLSDRSPTPPIRQQVTVIRLAGGIFTLRMAEQRVQAALATLPLQEFGPRMTEAQVRRGVTQLVAFINALENNHTRVRHANRLDVPRNARCNLTLYNLYILQFSLFVSVRRLRAREQDRTYNRLQLHAGKFIFIIFLGQLLTEFF